MLMGWKKKKGQKISTIKTSIIWSYLCKFVCLCEREGEDKE